MPLRNYAGEEYPSGTGFTVIPGVIGERPMPFVILQDPEMTKNTPILAQINAERKAAHAAHLADLSMKFLEEAQNA